MIHSLEARRIRLDSYPVEMLKSVNHLPDNSVHDRNDSECLTNQSGALNSHHLNSFISHQTKIS